MLQRKNRKNLIVELKWPDPEKHVTFVQDIFDTRRTAKKKTKYLQVRVSKKDALQYHAYGSSKDIM